MQQNWLTYEDDLKVRSLTDEEVREIQQLSTSCKEKFEISHDDDCFTIIDHIKVELHRCKENESEDDNLQNIAFEIGSLYGFLIVEKKNVG